MRDDLTSTMKEAGISARDGDKGKSANTLHKVSSLMNHTGLNSSFFTDSLYH
jgi:hypothetical protein